MRHESVVAPLGYVGNMVAKYEAAVPIRSGSRNKHEEQEIPKIGNRTYTELESQIRQ
jgi:hypothetical protein